jgi:hypothetical protein
MRTRTIPLDAETVEELKQQAKAFEAKFGRPPGPNDPVFFNPDSDVPEPMSGQQIAEYEAAIGDAMRAAGLAPAMVYAYERTGFIATEKNWHLMDKSGQQEWLDAIAEYDAIPIDPALKEYYAAA